jgi:ABC-type amino acid transport substrate-binding protein
VGITNTNTRIDRWRRRAVLCVLGGAALAGAPAHLLAATAPGRALRIAVIDLRPWTVHGAAGGGVFFELAQQLAQQAGIALDPVVVPYARAATLLARGEVDLMFSIDTARMRRTAVAGVHLSMEEVVVLTPRGVTVGSLADLRGKTVGRLRDADYDDAFAADAAIIKYDTASYEQELRMLLKGRIDAVIGVRSALLYALKEIGVAPTRLAPPWVLRQAPLALFMTQRVRDSEAGAALQAACQVLAERKAMATLIARYMDSAPTTVDLVTRPR